MRTISSIASAEGEARPKRPFGSISLGLGVFLAVGVLLLVVGEASIAFRVQDEILLEREQTRPPGRFSLRFEVHDFMAPGLAYVPLHAWVLWAGLSIALGRVAKRERAGMAVFFFALTLLVVEHALRAWLGRNGMYIGIPMNVFPW